MKTAFFLIVSMFAIIISYPLTILYIAWRCAEDNALQIREYLE